MENLKKKMYGKTHSFLNNVSWRHNAWKTPIYEVFFLLLNLFSNKIGKLELIKNWSTTKLLINNFLFKQPLIKSESLIFISLIFFFFFFFYSIYIIFYVFTKF